MDKKQFELLQTSVQWVWDDHHRKTAQERRRGLHHEQGLWVGGRVKEKIKALWGSHRKEFSVVCPTACCLGGHIVIANGDQLVVDEECDERSFVTSVEHCVDEEGQVRSIQARATELAGLTVDEASTLFDGGNTAEVIVREATRIARERGHRLEVL